MDQAQDLDSTVGRQAVDDEVTRLANATCRLDAAATEPKGVGMNTFETGHLECPDPARLLSERGLMTVKISRPYRSAASKP